MKTLVAGARHEARRGVTRPRQTENERKSSMTQNEPLRSMGLWAQIDSARVWPLLARLSLVLCILAANTQAEAASYQTTSGAVIDPIQRNAANGGGDLFYSGPNLEPGANLSGQLLWYGELPFAALQGADLSDGNFQQNNMRNARFDSAVATDAIFDQTDLANASLVAASFAGASFRWVDLSGASMRYATLTGANFSSSNLTGVNLTEAYLNNVSFFGANLSNANLAYSYGAASYQRATLTGANLEGVDLSRLNTSPGLIFQINNARLVRTYFGTADIYGANLSGSDLTEANFSTARLIEPVLTGANITGADFSGSILISVRSGGLIGSPLGLPGNFFIYNGHLVGSGADLTNADLSGIDLTGFDLENGTLTGANLTAADLTNAELGRIRSGGITGSPTLPNSLWSLVNGYLIGLYADLSGADLVGQDLTNAYFVFADLTGADLSNAILTGVRSGGITGDPTLPAAWQLIQGYLVGPGADLDQATLSGADLSAMDLSNTTLEYAELQNANLSSADLTNSNLVQAELVDADLSGANLTDARLNAVDLTNALLVNAILTGSNLAGADLSGAVLTFATLTGADLDGADLSGADLTGVASGGVTGMPILPTNWRLVQGYLVGPGASLSSANLSGADLSGVDLSDAFLFSADLEGANLSGANLGLTDLRSANLNNSDLRDADLSGSSLGFASVSGANFGGANLTNALDLGGTFGGADYDDLTDFSGTGFDPDTAGWNGPGEPPTVVIDSPGTGTTAIVGDVIDFLGSASDAEDGDLSSALNWTSDIDGLIGTGGSFSVSTLSLGTHSITASSIDSRLNEGVAQIVLLVSPVPALYGLNSGGGGNQILSIDTETGEGTTLWTFSDAVPREYGGLAWRPGTGSLYYSSASIQILSTSALSAIPRLEGIDIETGERVVYPEISASDLGLPIDYSARFINAAAISSADPDFVVASIVATPGDIGTSLPERTFLIFLDADTGLITNPLLDVIETVEPLESLVYSPDGSVLYGGAGLNGARLVSIDETTGVLTDISIADLPTTITGLAFSGGALLAALGEFDDALATIRLDDGMIDETRGELGMPAPAGIAYVPEPGLLSMLSAGLLGLVGLRRARAGALRAIARG